LEKRQAGAVCRVRYDSRLAKPKRTFVLTNTLLDNDPEDAEWFQDVVQLARDRNAHFLPVRLTLSAEELARRVVSPGRAEQFKEVDPVAAMKKANESQVLRPQGHDVLEMDITTMTAEEVAGRIVERLQQGIARRWE
jgi:chloramphenicol 3-O-phosphotransferase